MLRLDLAAWEGRAQRGGGIDPERVRAALASAPMSLLCAGLYPCPSIVARVAAFASKGEASSAIDLCCGAGSVLDALRAERRSLGGLVGVDVAPQLVRAARARGLVAHAADPEAAAPLGPFDAAYSVGGTLAGLPARAILAGASACLRPGGRLLIVELVRRDASECAPREARDALRALAAAFGASGFSCAAALERTAADVGFRVSRRRDLSAEVAAAARAASARAALILPAAWLAALAERLFPNAFAAAVAARACAEAIGGGSLAAMAIEFTRA